MYIDSNGKGANYYSNPNRGPNSGFYQPVGGGARMGDIICTALGLGCLVCLFRAALVEPEVAGGFKAFRKHMYKVTTNRHTRPYQALEHFTTYHV
jgi:hypothetical protein